MQDPAFLFSRHDYCLSLPHLGRPLFSPGLDTTLLVRPIPDTGHADLTGPWPYAVAPRPDAAAEAVAALRQKGYVSLTMFLRPDTPAADIATLSAALRESSEIAPLKEHYIRDPRLPPPEIRTRTRRHLARADRHWRIRPLARAEIAPVCSALQERLAARVALSDYARVPAEHFERISELDEIEAMAATDDEGPGAVLIAARTDGATHLLHFLTSPRVIRYAGSYLLWSEALRRWSRDGCVYLGGVPGSDDGPGIAQFKARWANRVAPAFLLKAILDPEAYRALSAGTAGSFFPAYRSART